MLFEVTSKAELAADKPDNAMLKVAMQMLLNELVGNLLNAAERHAAEPARCSGSGRVAPAPIVTLSTVPLTSVVTAVPPRDAGDLRAQGVGAGRRLRAAARLAVPREIRESRRLRAEIDRLHQHARAVGDVEHHLGTGLRHADGAGERAAGARQRGRRSSRPAPGARAARRPAAPGSSSSEFDSALNEVLSWVMPCTSLSEASWLRKVLLSTGLVGS